MFAIVWFLAVVLGILFLLASQQDLSTSSQEEQSLFQGQRGTIGSYIETVKQFSFHALRNAATRASFESAESGAGAENGYWIQYARPTAPTVGTACGSIESPTGTDSNIYLNLLTGKEYGPIELTDTGSYARVKVWVEEGDLKPTYDPIIYERFIVSGDEGRSATVRNLQTGEERKAPLESTIPVYPLRYWWLYKVIRDWTNQNILSVYTCSAMQLVSGTGSGPCCVPIMSEDIIDQVVSRAVERLQQEFDQQDNFVTCSYEILCRHADTVVLKVEAPPISCPAGCTCACPQGCNYNTNHDDPCVSGECKDPYCPEPGSDVPEPSCYQAEVPYAPQPWEGACQNIDGQCYGFGEEHTISFIARIRCIDEKFQSPIREDEFKNLNFSILTHVYLKHRVEPEIPTPSVVCPPGNYPANYPGNYPPSGYQNSYPPSGYQNSYPPSGYQNSYPPSGYESSYPSGYESSYPASYPNSYESGYESSYPASYPPPESGYTPSGYS